MTVGVHDSRLPATGVPLGDTPVRGVSASHAGRAGGQSTPAAASSSAAPCADVRYRRHGWCGPRFSGQSYESTLR